MLELKGTKVVVLGLGDTGMSMVRWLRKRGAVVTAADTRAQPPRAQELASEFDDVPLVLGDFKSATLSAAELIAISPGIDRRTPEIAAAIERGISVVGDVELFAQALPQLAGARGSQPKTIAVTGTNGKSTVTRMAGDICAAGGLNPVVAGNIGTPVLDALTALENGTAMPGAFVLELSSFQLESTVSLAADAATVLNVSEDHLDRHGTVEQYARAKARIFAGDGAQVLNRDDAYSRAMALPGRRIERFGQSAPAGEHEWGLVSHAGRQWLQRAEQKLMAADELAVSGLHNAANALAAGALCSVIGVSDADICAALRKFKGLPHRAERIATIAGVTYYDDSKGTNVGSTVAALSGFTQPVVLIAGGEGKGQDFTPLRDVVARHARAVILIGRDREIIASALAGCGVPLDRAADMHEAVVKAQTASRSGDAVLLSPACASFDMFRNYAHRGEMYATAVRELEPHDC